MRQELDHLITSTINGEDKAARVLHDVLEGCLDLQARSPEAWEGHPPERVWAESHVEEVAPDLAYFLPTPAELEEALRRLRLGLLHDGRLNVPVMSALDRYADRSVLFVLVDVLGSYDGAPERHGEIEVAMQLLAGAAEDVADSDRARVRQAIERIRDVGGDIADGEFSLRYWANNELAGAFGDEDAQLELETNRRAPEDQLKLDRAVKARLDSWVEIWTAEVIVLADKVDEECARHLSIWTRNVDGTSTSRPLVPMAGSAAESEDDMSPLRSLSAAIWGARLDPTDVPELLDDIVSAKWQRPHHVQVLVKEQDDPFRLYKLRDGKLIHYVPVPETEARVI